VGNLRRKVDRSVKVCRTVLQPTRPTTVLMDLTFGNSKHAEKTRPRTDPLILGQRRLGSGVSIGQPIPRGLALG
jgi:hypothetical protein